MPLDYDKLIKTRFESRQAYTRKDTILYALGVGCGQQDHVDLNEIKYVYERDLVALPTLAVTLAAGTMLLADPEFGVNHRMLLHGEQALLSHKPLPVEGIVVSHTTVDDIYDKGASKGAMMYMTRKLYDEASGDLLVTMGTVTFLRSDDGFDGKRTKVLCGDDPARFRRLDLRFTSPVYPGEPLRLDIWNIAPGDASFRLIASDRDVVVEDFGRFEYQSS